MDARSKSQGIRKRIYKKIQDKFKSTMTAIDVDHQPVKTVNSGFLTSQNPIGVPKSEYNF